MGEIFSLTLILPIVTMDSFFGECRARSACAYVQSDLTLYSPLFFQKFLSKMSQPVPFNELTLSQTTILDASKLKGLADDNFKVDKNSRVLQMGRKHYGERRNCSLRAISPLSTVFSKDLHWSQGLCGKGLSYVCVLVNKLNSSPYL